MASLTYLSWNISNANELVDTEEEVEVSVDVEEDCGASALSLPE